MLMLKTYFHFNIERKLSRLWSVEKSWFLGLDRVKLELLSDVSPTIARGIFRDLDSRRLEHWICHVQSSESNSNLTRSNPKNQDYFHIILSYIFTEWF